ncbi:MAG: 2-polyprenyl-6-methoxyphenol hydroxylase [Actinomycetota bacterium]|nr:MAG: 2-polyprenyl-6-methoxyphenol hydroxylase [Actinomycetota bacterium]
MRVACIGGGPGGVFFATLLRQMSPQDEVVVFERNRADDTFGFGVVFSDATLSNLGAADPVLRDRLGRYGQTWDQIEVRSKGETLRCGGNGMAAIARKELLRLLYQRAAEVGVDLRFQNNVSSLDQLKDFDLIVGSDGANSLVRNQLIDSFSPSIQKASAKFIWFGTTYRFKGLTFLFEESKDGIFAVHGYPIDDNTGTFIVETDEATWLRAGMDGFDVSQPPGLSDQFSKEYLQDLFSAQIEDAELLVNNSRWANFRTIRNGSWHAGRFVLIGDSAHTAHFSVGSGTKMAMEDAASLAGCLASRDDSLDEALTAYEHIRRPSVDAIQGSAGPSLSWWEHFGRYFNSLEPQQFVFHFLTRAISAARVRRRDPEFVEGALQWWKAKYGSEPLKAEFDFGDFCVSSRIADIRKGADGAATAVFATPKGAKLLDLLQTAPSERQQPFGWIVDIADSEDGLSRAKHRLGEIVVAGPAVVAVGGGTSLERVLLAEECRMAYRVPSMIIEGSYDEDCFLTSILSGRTDFIGLPEGIRESDSVAGTSA